MTLKRMESGSLTAASLQAQVRDRIAGMIADGTLPPGTPLPSFRELARQMGVSVTPLHRAIRELSDAGLVEVRHGSGAWVAKQRTGFPSDIAGVLGRELAPAKGTVNRSYAVGVVSRLAREERPWKHRIITALEHTLGAAGGVVTFYNQLRDDGSLAPLGDVVDAALADGMTALALIEAAADAPTLEQVWDTLHRLECPHVLVSAAAHRGPLNSVYYDSEWAGYLATEYACQRGHRNIALPLFSADEWGPTVLPGAAQGWIAERTSGVARACRRYAASLHPVAVARPDALSQDGIAWPEGMWVRSGREVAECLLASRRPGSEEMPTLLVALNDVMALAAIERLAEAGCTVPETLSVLGFDNDEAGRAAQLTSVEPPLEELGAEAATLLLRLLARGGSPRRNLPVQHVLVPPKLVPRRSVAAPPGDGRVTPGGRVA